MEVHRGLFSVRPRTQNSPASSVRESKRLFFKKKTAAGGVEQISQAALLTTSCEKQTAEGFTTHLPAGEEGFLAWAWKTPAVCVCTCACVHTSVQTTVTSRLFPTPPPHHQGRPLRGLFTLRAILDMPTRTARPRGRVRFTLKSVFSLCFYAA